MSLVWLGCLGSARRSELENHCSAGLLRLCLGVRTWKSLFGWAASAAPGGPNLEVTVRLGCFGCAIEITGRSAAMLRTEIRAAAVAP